MYWGRVGMIWVLFVLLLFLLSFFSTIVAAIYTIGVLLVTLLSIGTFAINVNVSSGSNARVSFGQYDWSFVRLLFLTSLAVGGHWTAHWGRC
jgi:hypothetical protein